MPLYEKELDVLTEKYWLDRSRHSRSLARFSRIRENLEAIPSTLDPGRSSHQTGARGKSNYPFYSSLEYRLLLGISPAPGSTSMAFEPTAGEP